ncbi:MAG: cation-translocating P-type ATPase [bacterium]
MNHWWELSTADAVKELGSNTVAGLNSQDVPRRLVEYGPNVLVERGMKSPWRILWEQLTGVMVMILIIAAIVSALLGEHADAVVISTIVVLNALLGLSQEYRAEKAMASLKRLAVPMVKVRRDGEVQELASHGLVPGDIVILEAGNLVPADCRLLAAINLRIQEAALTGESEPVEKDTQVLSGPETTVGDRLNMAYMGTIVTYGRGEALVVATGMRTELGGIATMMQAVKREGTPLQKRLEQLGKGLAVVAVALVIVIFVQGIVRGGTGLENLKLMFLTAISMAVAAIPEGLPAVVTIALALGAQRMLARNALIRKLLAVETLGSVTVICSDKTGTLTENRMTVKVLAFAGHQIDLTEHLEMCGRVSAEKEVPLPFLADAASLEPLLVASALCNDATLQSHTSKRDQPVAIGDPTEGALIVAAALVGLRKGDLEQAFPRVGEVPFDSDRKRMTTIHRAIPPRGADLLKTLQAKDAQAPHYAVFCKGAVDSLLGICTKVRTADGHQSMTEEDGREILAANDGLAQQGMRVLGVGFTLLGSDADIRNPEHDMVFLGMIGMIDPPRPEVRDAVQICKRAGIRPVMITGDHPSTAMEIARQLGIASDAAVLTGVELDKLTAEELSARADDVTVYARVSPEHKLKIIQALQQRGHIVAMTGDGVNDAPALRKADIGVAMGITGTDVSKEAADMVLQDDNFATIVAAVEEGRVIYDNIRKFIRYLLSTNSGELWVMLLAPWVGLPLPLLPIQILWMNLVTDGLPALALGVEPAERDVMQRPPRPVTGHIFGGGMGRHILWVGLLMAVVALGTGYWFDRSGRVDFAMADDLAYFRTFIFTLLTFMQMSHVLAIRSERQSLFTMGLLSNRPLLGAVSLTISLQMALVYIPFLQKYFQTVPLAFGDLFLCLILSTTIFWAVELEKFRMRRKG